MWREVPMLATSHPVAATDNTVRVASGALVVKADAEVTAVGHSCEVFSVAYFLIAITLNLWIASTTLTISLLSKPRFLSRKLYNL